VAQLTAARRRLVRSRILALIAAMARSDGHFDR
jgi:hypothetical protein